MRMFTAEEIRNIAFTKTMGGYKTSEVDDFIDQCADTVEALTREKAEQAKKMQVLADKLVEYRNDEDNIRTALLTAQRMGDTVLREANHKAELVLEDAKIKAQKIEDAAKNSITGQEEELRRVKEEVAKFKARLLSMYREHLALIDVMPEPEIPSDPAAPAQEEAVAASAAAEAEEAAVEAALEPETSAAPVVIEPVDGPTRPIVEREVRPRFADLQFGEEYDQAGEKKGAFGKRK